MRLLLYAIVGGSVILGVLAAAAGSIQYKLVDEMHKNGEHRLVWIDRSNPQHTVYSDGFYQTHFYDTDNDGALDRGIGLDS